MFNRLGLKGLLVTIFLGGFLSACSSDKDPTKIAYKSGGVVINYSANNKLNFYDGSSHTLMLAIYQLSNINSFHQFSQSEGSRQKLLTLNKFDDSVVVVDNKFIPAGESGVITLDRPDNVTWIGIVAGYYDSNTATVKEYQITDKDEPLRVDLRLGADKVSGKVLK